MIRPLTCLSLVAALGAGLYLYQEKHRAQLLDRDITRTVKQADQARERIGLLKAEWALLNEPERLAGLAAQHLQLQSLQPTQFVRLEDLRSRLPAVMATPATPAAMDEPPMAAVVPAQPPRTQVAIAQPVATPVSATVAIPAPARPVPTPAAIMASASAQAPTPAQTHVPVKPLAAPISGPAVQLAAAHPTPAPRATAAAKPHEAEIVAHAPEPERHPLFAPVMPAYAPTPVVIHAPTVQTASAIAPAPPAYVGSALGMAHGALAAPVPVSSAPALGYSYGR